MHAMTCAHSAEPMNSFTKLTLDVQVILSKEAGASVFPACLPVRPSEPLLSIESKGIKGKGLPVVPIRVGEPVIGASTRTSESVPDPTGMGVVPSQ